MNEQFGTILVSINVKSNLLSKKVDPGPPKKKKKKVMHGLTLVLQQTLQKFFLDANILEKNTKVDKVAWIPLVTVK